MVKKNNVVTVRLTDEQLDFFIRWQKQAEEKMEMEIPLGAIIRRALDGVINHYSSRELPEQGVQGDEPGRREKARAFIDEYKKEE